MEAVLGVLPLPATQIEDLNYIHNCTPEVQRIDNTNDGYFVCHFHHRVSCVDMSVPFGVLTPPKLMGKDAMGCYGEMTHDRASLVWKMYVLSIWLFWVSNLKFPGVDSLKQTARKKPRLIMAKEDDPAFFWGTYIKGCCYEF